MSGGSLGKNAVWNIAEVVGSSLVLFVLYKLILARLGVSALGVWSLVLATTSLARIADLGAAGGLSRYVALAQGRGATGDDALVYVETALVTNILFYGFLSLAIYWPAWLGLGAVTNGPATVEARLLLPYAIASFTLMNVSNVITAAFIGLHRSYQKSMVVLAALAVQVFVAALLIGRLGLRAVAVGQVVQYTIVAIVGWVLIHRNLGRTARVTFPHRMSRSALRELVGFGLRLQILNLAAFPFEPITKFVFSTVGGLQALGLYELASRGFLQVRQVVVAPSQNLTPLFASRYSNNKELRSLYARAVATMIVSGGLAMSGLAIGSPVISYVWLGHVEPLFIFYSVILATGWFCNIASAPGYYLGIGSGRLRWNIVGAIMTTGLACALGFGLGKLAGPLAIAGGAMAAVALGSLLTWHMNCRVLNLEMAPRRSEWLDLIRRVEAQSRRLIALRIRA